IAVNGSMRSSVRARNSSSTRSRSVRCAGGSPCCTGRCAAGAEASGRDFGEPLAAVGQRPLADGPLSGGVLVLAAQALAVRGGDRPGIDRREQAEIDVHRLEGAAAALLFGKDVTAGDMAEQGAEGRGR